MPSSNSSTLPFAVDGTMAGPIFIPSGYEPDGKGITASACPSRSSASAVGSCHGFTFDWGADSGATAGWVGVVWQNPANNWGSSVGYAIPAGATKVTFYARGAQGGEQVTFGAGLQSATAVCADAVMGSLGAQTLANTWQEYTMPLTGTYAGGVVAAFSWSAVEQQGDGGATSLTFFVDDIQWTM